MVKVTDLGLTETMSTAVCKFLASEPVFVTWSKCQGMVWLATEYNFKLQTIFI